MTIYKIRAGRVPGIGFASFVGIKDTLFYDTVTGDLRISDGQTAGGLPSTLSNVVINFQNISDFSIPGGSNGQVLTTDGNGNLSWSNSSGTADTGSWTFDTVTATTDGNIIVKAGSSEAAWASLLSNNGANSFWVDDVGAHVTSNFVEGETTENYWTFGTDGTLTLPQGSYITETAAPLGAAKSLDLHPGNPIYPTQYLRIYPTNGGDADHLHLTSGDSTATELFLGDDEQYVKLANNGNVEIRTGALDYYNDTKGVWTFDSDGVLTLPTHNATPGSRIKSAVDITIETGPYYLVDLVTVGSGNGGGICVLDFLIYSAPDWATAVAVGDHVVSGTWTGIITAVEELSPSEDGRWRVTFAGEDFTGNDDKWSFYRPGAAGGTWKFGTDGTTTFPTLTVPISDNATPSGTGQTIKFSDSTQQAIIYGPESTAGATSAERVIIQGAPGYTGTSGEGGDVYLWAGPGGDADGNGGDIKVRAGFGPGTGQGGYLNFQAGDSSTGTGGYINIESGESSTYGSGGDITMQARSGGEITLRTYGPGSTDWTFGADGTLTLPLGGDIVDSTGTTVLGGGGAGPVQPYLELTNDPFITQPVVLGTPVTVSTPGNGSDASFEVIIGEGPEITSITITVPGTDYIVGQRYRVWGFNIGGTDIDRDSIVFEVETVGAAGELLTISNVAFTGAATNTPITSYTNAVYRASPGDAIDAGVTLARGANGALFNIEEEAEYDDNSYVSPIGTEWNSDGWGDLVNLQSRSYGTFRSALNNNIGNEIIGAELVMHDTINNRYYKFSFSDWGQDNGGSYAYTRTEITDPNYFEKTDGGEEVDEISAGLHITRGNDGWLYNPLEDEGDDDATPTGSVWNNDGWEDLSDVESRTYVPLETIWDGNFQNIVGSRMIMLDTTTDLYWAIEMLSWTEGGGFSYIRRELDPTQLQQGITFPDGTVLNSAEGIGRVKLTAPVNRRIEEVYGYNKVYLTVKVTTNLTTVASRAETGGYYIWIDSTATTIDDIIGTPSNYGNAYEFEFSLDNNTWYAWAGGTAADGEERGYSVPQPVTYLQGDTVYFRYKTGGNPVVWWSSADLPGGSGNFRGAVIDYHAYTGEATIIGTIHIVDDDGDEHITHTEVSSGSTDSENDDLWLVQNEGTISYRRIDGESKALRIQWTAKVFYGSELYD